MKGTVQAKKKKLLELAKDGLSQQNIAKTLNCSPSTILRAFRKLEKDGLVQIVPGRPTFYKLTEKGRTSVGQTSNRLPRRKPSKNQKPLIARSDVAFLQNTLCLHDYKVRFPLLQQGLPPKGKTIKYHNYKAHVYEFSRPFKHKIQLTTRSLMVFVYKTPLPRNLSYEQKIHQLTSIVDSLAANFAMKNGYSIDIIHSKVISQHISANPSEIIDERIPDHTVATLRLGKRAESVKGKMKDEAKAWVDKSGGLTDIETNDLAYERMLLELPLKVHSMERHFAAIEEYTKQIKLHLEVEKQQLKTQKETQKLLKAIRMELKKR